MGKPKTRKHKMVFREQPWPADFSFEHDEPPEGSVQLGVVTLLPPLGRDQLVWLLFELERFWSGFAEYTASAAYPSKRSSASMRASQVSRTLRALLHAHLRDDDEALGELDSLAGKLLRLEASKVKGSTVFLGVSAVGHDHVKLPDLERANNAVPKGDRDRRPGEPEDPHGPAIWTTTILADEITERTTGAGLADWFVTGNGEGVRCSVAPAPFDALRDFFVAAKKDFQSADRTQIAKKLTRELENHRIEKMTEQARRTLARKLLLVACRAVGVSKDRARSLFDAERKRKVRRDTRARVPPQMT